LEKKEKHFNVVQLACKGRRIPMKFFLIFFIFLIGIGSLFPAYALQDNGKSDEASLKNIDAIQAVAIANEWKWSKKEIKSYVNSQEVVFQFPDGKAKMISLSEEKMVVAVAPYIKQTHT
jgi:hypothetical protein